MAYELNVQKKAKEQRLEGTCDQQRVLTTLHLMEKGTKQAFLDGDLGLEETKEILDHLREAAEACQAGDENACVVLGRLMNGLTKREES